MKESFSSAIEAVANFADIFHAKRIKNYYKTKVIDTVIDVGSHKGEFINLVCDDKIPIYSFEPQSSVRELLIDNTKNKNIVEYYDYALSSYDGSIDLFLNKLTSTTSTIPPNEKSYWVRFKKLILGGELLSGKESVGTTTLDKLFSGKLEESGAILLKIDVEGAEGDVLMGAENIISEYDVAYIQIESANYKIYSATKSPDALKILAKHGYHVDKRFLFPLLNFSDIVFSKVDRQIVLRK
jgi:FkbM family methyltransferase